MAAPHTALLMYTYMYPRSGTIIPSAGRCPVSRRLTAPTVPPGPSGLQSANLQQLHDLRTRTCYTATVVFWSTVLLCGTVCRVSCVQRTCHWTFLKDKLKTFLFRTVYQMRICGLNEFARYKSPYSFFRPLAQNCRL